MDPIKLFTVITLVALPTVMFGGYSLLRLTPQRKLTDFQHTYFRVGHAHAGVLLVMTLAALDVTARGALGDGARWVVGVLLLVGTLAQSGGFFLHMMLGKQGSWSKGNTLSVGGAILLTVGLLLAAYGFAVK